MPKVVVIDGIIGAGKTTYIDILKKTLPMMNVNAIFVDEPVKNWVRDGLLDKFYEDPKRWGYHFQTKVFRDRIMACLEAFQKPADLYIVERSPLTDTIFAKTLHKDSSMSDMEYEHYLQWCNLWERLLPHPFNVFIYLKPHVEEAMKRIQLRNRGNEASHISKEYQDTLERFHDETFTSENIATVTQGGRCYVYEEGIDISQSPEEITSEFLKIIE